MFPASQARRLASPGEIFSPVSSRQAFSSFPRRTSRSIMTTTVAEIPPVFGTRSTG